MSLLAIEDAIESQPAPFWDRALGQWLKDGKTRVVYQVIRSRLTFIFRGAGGSGLDLRWCWGPSAAWASADSGAGATRER